MEPQGARLWLIRHGQTDWNAAGRIQGHTPTDLNAKGRAQAAALAEMLAHRTRRHFAACYASDLPRASQTADAIAGKLGLTISTTPALRERSFGKYEGATSDEIRDVRTSLGLNQTGDLADWTGMPGIETNDEVWNRVVVALREISNQHAAQDVLVVTHGGVIARAIYRTLAIPDGTPRHFPLSNGIVAVLQWRIDAFYLLSLVDMSLLLGEELTPDTATIANPATQ